MHEFFYEVGVIIVGFPIACVFMYIGGVILKKLNLGQEDAGRGEY